jgi:hypothetical protein
VACCCAVHSEEPARAQKRILPFYVAGEVFLRARLTRILQELLEESAHFGILWTMKSQNVDGHRRYSLCIRGGSTASSWSRLQWACAELLYMCRLYPWIPCISHWSPPPLQGLVPIAIAIYRNTGFVRVGDRSAPWVLYWGVWEWSRVGQKEGSS